MSKQVNYPYTINTLSANGSAEVIARGINNDYITQWSLNTNTIDSWDNVENFPTVVRTGNFVWCWYREYSDRAIYVLIDVVPDPEVEYQLGNNIAYPALLNDSVGEITNAVTSASVQTDNMAAGTARTVTDGPYYPLTVAGQYNHVANAANGYKSGFWSSGRSYKEIVADKWGDTPNVWGGFAVSNGQYVPWLIGWGGLQKLLTTTNGDDGDPIQGIFAPFATYEQFQTLYGAEKDWIHSTHGSTYKTLFGPTYSPNGAGVQYTNTADIENDYPFTVEAMQPQIKYRNVPGDTTGDGLDNTPSFEDALALTAVASIIECDGFPGDLIPGLDMEAINKKLKAAKAGIESAIDSTGLLDLGKKLEGFKDGLLDKFPDPTKVLNFIEAIADLDLNNIAKEGIELIKDNLKEEWREAIDDVDEFVDGIIDNIADFDICSLTGLKGKTGADGKLVKKPETPSIPDKPIEAPKQSSYAPTQSKGTAQTAAAGAAGITPKDLENANNVLEDNWKDLSEDDQFSWGRKIEIGPLQGPRRTIIRDEIEFEAVLDENGELVPKVRADGSRILSTDPDAFGSGAPPPYNDFSISDEANAKVRVPLQPSMVKIHGSTIGTVYHRNQYKNLYADGNGGGRYTGIYKNPLSPSPENDVSIFDLVKPPNVEGITDTDPEVQKRVADYINLEGGGSPEAANKLSEQPVSKTGPEWEKRLQEIKASKDYQTYVTAINNKVDPRVKYSLPGDSELNSRGGMSQESLDKLGADIRQVTIGLYIYREWKARFNYYKEKLKNSMLVDGKRGEYFPSTDYDITNKWKTYNEAYPESLRAPGSSFYLNDIAAVNQTGFVNELFGATITEKAANTVAGMDDEFITAIGMYFFNEEGVRLQQEIMLGQDPPYDKAIQDKLLDALAPDDTEGDPTCDNVAPIENYDPKEKAKSSGTVSNPNLFGKAFRYGPVQPKLMSILEASVTDPYSNYSISIFSAGQVPVSRGGENRVNRYGNTKRHDDGFAVDIYTYDENGRQLRVQADPNHKDTLAIRDFIIILLKNGITSVGCDDDYMNGDLHVDIANSNNGVAPIAHWGKGPAGVENRYSKDYAPAWLTKIFNGDYNKQYQEMVIRKEKEKEKNNKG